MAKYILALIEVEDNTAPESVVMNLSYPETGVAKSRYAILDSAKECHAKAFKMIDDIIDSPICAQLRTAMRDKLDTFREYVDSVLTDEKPAPRIPDDDLFEIYNEFQNRLDRDDTYWDIYWDTLRDVLFKHGYEPDWEE